MQFDPLNNVKKFVRSEFILQNSVSVTLSCRQRVDGERLDEIVLSGNVKHFLNRLNSRLLNKKFDRFRKRLGTISVIEGDDATRLHVHQELEIPNDTSVESFENIVRECWGKTKFGYPKHCKNAVVVTDTVDSGWLDYMLKKRTKRHGILQSIDWENTHRSSLE